jgi:hypothetical protein
MDATESLSPPIFVARRMAASAEDMTVPSAMANGTIVSGPLGKYLVATSAVGLTPLVQVLVDGLNGLRERGRGRT